MIIPLRSIEKPRRSFATDPSLRLKVLESRRSLGSIHTSNKGPGAALARANRRDSAMRHSSAIVFSAIAPHPPIMVPEVGGEACAEVRGSIDAMAELTRRLIRSGAESLILISPHAPLEVDAFVAYRDQKLVGDFSRFHAPETSVAAQLDEQLLNQIVSAAQAESLDISDLDQLNLDHGTAVPLYFIERNGWRGDVVALGYSFLSERDHLRFGECLRRAADKIGKPTALIASGDLSHRLKPSAPAGYNPTAYLFDDQIVNLINEQKPELIAEIDPQLRRSAGECGYRSMLVALGATQGLAHECEVLHYEAPFGVGYLVAQLTSAISDSDRERFDVDLTELLPRLARQAVETYTRSGAKLVVDECEAPILSARAACFVSLKTLEGDLRGCIGTIDPVNDCLAEELVMNAIGAASRDPRFSPVNENELPFLRYSVDVLSAPEPASLEELDPRIFGVIVEEEAGQRRGLLLPDINGIDTVEQQVEIATRKAGIAPGTKVRFLRFRVDRFRESERLGN